MEHCTCETMLDSECLNVWYTNIYVYIYIYIYIIYMYMYMMYM